MQSTDGESLGPAARPDLIRETAIQDLGEIPGIAVDDSRGFFAEATKYLRTWVSHASLPAGPAAAVLLLDKYPRTFGEQRNWTRVLGFKYEPRGDIVGRVLATSARLANGYASSPVFTSVAQAFHWLEASQLEATFCVIADLEQRKAYCCLNGSGDEDSIQEVSLEAASVALTVEAIEELLGGFYTTWVRIPRPPSVVFWKDATKRIPIERAETQIEGHLWLVAKLLHDTTHAVRKEDSTDEGRADVTMTPKPTAGASGSCVLELKVLRSRYASALDCPSTKNEEAIADGIDQSAAYRRQLGLDWSYLCCFDMRDDDESGITDSAAERAAERAVTLRRYFLYSDQPSNRAAKTSETAH